MAVPGLHVTASAATPPPAPRATAWLVADATTGTVLAACNAHVPLAPASTLKVLTALALFGRIDPARGYVARQEDAAVDGTRVGLVPGSVYSTDDLWHGLLLSSGNDAATALAWLAGGTASATAAMQDRARGLGAADTRVLNTSGLDEPGQVSSAYDLALFGRAAIADPALSRLMRTRSYAFPEAGAVSHAPTRKTYQIQNHDRLLYNYPGALGVKNGWTSTTGGSFIGAARRGDRSFVVTVLAADPETWHMCAALLDWAFRTSPAGAPDVSADVGRLVTGPDPDGALPGSTVAVGAAAAPGDSGSPADRGSPATGAVGTAISSPVTVVAGVLGLAGVGAAGGVAVRAFRRRRP